MKEDRTCSLRFQRKERSVIQWGRRLGKCMSGRETCADAKIREMKERRVSLGST